MEQTNIQVARAAIKLAISEGREEETRLKQAFLAEGIRCVAVDFGGVYLPSIPNMVQRAVVAAKREHVIRDIHLHEGAIAGATREALSQISPRAVGFNVGGKIAVARGGEHLTVVVFVGIGLLHLDDVAIGMAHRAVPE